LLTVTDAVFPLVLCLYYVCISISVFDCGLSIFQ